MTILDSNFRELAIALLNDNEGINEKAWDCLSVMLVDCTDPNCSDIVNAVEATDGRFYLSEDFKE